MAESQTGNEVKKSPKKLIVIIVIALLVLGGAAAGGYFYFKNLSGGEHSKGDGKEKKAEDEHKSAPEHEQPESEVFYNMVNPLIVDFPEGGSAKVIKISLTILLDGEASVAMVKKHEPMIRNNLLMAISAIGAEKAKTTEGKLELKGLMLTEIGKVLEKMSGKNTVKDVYFTEFVMQ